MHNLTQLQAVRAAAERLKRMDAGAGIQTVYGQFSPDIDDMAAIWNNDRIRTSEAFIDLTDPTPLTVEKLVECGGNEHRVIRQGWVMPGRHLRFSCGVVVLKTHGGICDWVWENENDGNQLIYPEPRTAGELRQLLLRLEAKS